MKSVVPGVTNLDNFALSFLKFCRVALSVSMVDGLFHKVGV